MIKMTNGIKAKEGANEQRNANVAKNNIEQNILNNQKWYNYKDRKVCFTYLQLYEKPKETQLQQWLKVLVKSLQETCSEMIVFVIYETKNSITYEYHIMSDCIKELISNKMLPMKEKVIPLIETRYLEEMTTEEKAEAIIKKFKQESKTIATMESYTGGQLASEITSVSLESEEVLHESYISYSDESKIKFGISEEAIKKYTVYSPEIAIEMAKSAKNMAKSTIGIGIAGKMRKVDPNNMASRNSSVWYSIYEQDKLFVCKLFFLEDLSSAQKKDIVIREIIEKLYNW